MTWVRFDDQASIHRKVAPLDDATYRLWREAIEWSARNLTDGVILADELSECSKRGNALRATKLIDRDLWHVAGAFCPSPKCPPAGKDGWVIHDYFDYQPSREKVRAEQAAKADRQKKWMETQKRRKDDASIDASQDAPRDAPLNITPSPPRPAPKGRVGTTSPQRRSAAAGDGAAADGEPNEPGSPMCPTCGNTIASAYHRRVCGAERGAA